MPYHRLIILSRPRMVFNEPNQAKALDRAIRYYGPKLVTRSLGKTIYLSLNGRDIGYIEPFMVSSLVVSIKQGV